MISGVVSNYSELETPASHFHQQILTISLYHPRWRLFSRIVCVGKIGRRGKSDAITFGLQRLAHHHGWCSQDNMGL